MTVHLYTDASGKHRWRAVADNGRIIADSGQGYSTRSNARRAWRRFQLLAKGYAWIEEQP